MAFFLGLPVSRAHDFAYKWHLNRFHSPDVQKRKRRIYSPDTGFILKLLNSLTTSLNENFILVTQVKMQTPCYGTRVLGAQL